MQKVAKIALIAVGLLLGAILYMASQKLLTVDWIKINEQLTGWFSNFANGDIGGSVVGQIITAVGVMNSSAFGIGLFAGFMRG